MGLVVDMAKCNDLKKGIASLPDEIDAVVLQAFDDIARRCETEIGTEVRQGWKDRTGNLFSSIGLALAKDGMILRFYGFGGKGFVGKVVGKRLIADTLSELPKGIAIVAVAGMDYAEYMEARDVIVLTSVDRLIEQGFNETMEELRRRLSGNED